MATKNLGLNEWNLEGDLTPEYDKQNSNLNKIDQAFSRIVTPNSVEFSSAPSGNGSGRVFKNANSTIDYGMNIVDTSASNVETRLIVRDGKILAELRRDGVMVKAITIADLNI